MPTAREVIQLVDEIATIPTRVQMDQELKCDLPRLSERHAVSKVIALLRRAGRDPKNAGDHIVGGVDRMRLLSQVNSANISQSMNPCLYQDERL
jgi:hypothetical protein